MNLVAELDVVAVTRYDIPTDDGRPNVRGTKIHYLGDSVKEHDALGRQVISINGPYELFDRFAAAAVPGKFKVSLGQKMSGKKAVLKALSVA